MANDISDDFDESQCELVRYVILQKEIEDDDIEYTSIELHTTVGIPMVLQGQSITKSGKINPYTYRVYTHEGKLSETKDENSGIKRSYLAKSGPEALAIFKEQHDIWTSPPHNMTKTKVMLSRWLGSNVLTKRLLESQASKGEVSSEVARLADNLWTESMGELSQILTVPVKSIALGKVEKAESVLLQIKRALLDKETKDDSVIQRLSAQFHELIPHQAECRKDLINMKMVAIKQDLCQLIQDVINVNEALGWKKQPSAKSKYRAMRCYIENLDKDHPEYEKVEELVMTSQQPIDQEVSIQRIFAVNRALDEFKFNRTIGNERLLFHASKACNFLGILSRGILLPKIVVEMFGIDRWDAGMLGSGIYFGDSTSTCAKYSAPGKFTGTRFLAVNNVALGNIKDIYEKRTDIESAPQGFDSVHGVRKTDQVESFFVDDEYVVYQANQHCLRYLVEFKLIEKNVDEPDSKSVSTSQATFSDDSGSDDTDSDDELDDEIDTLDVQGMVYPEAKVKAGLNTSGVEGQVELEAVHVRASIIDLAAEVTVLQKYRNVGDKSAETRYVFPLDERAAVCGFDAYINGKHVVGVVKEKAEARKSYAKAKQEGHGAYLMEEEATNVFTITVGNLPPGSCVLICVRYVTELVVEGDRIAFNLLGSVAPWKKKEILSNKFDHKGDSVDGVVENKRNRSESFMATITMPSKIRSVHCPTHSINIRQKDEKVMDISMCEGDRLVDGLQLLVDMDNAHKPRIWREKLPDDQERQACMVVFYPEFPVTTIENPEVVIMLDRSTSMKGQPMIDAKKLVHMILENLPPGSRYNLVIFGNDFEELYPASVLATDENIKHTETFLLTVTWERGATEVWRPLRALSLLSSNDVRLTSNGFLISDGHVTNEQDTLMEVASNRQINRLFTFGVSSESNRHVLRTLADTGGGAYEQFDPRSKSTWEAKVQAQVRRSCQPAATSIKVNWISTHGDAPRTLTRKEIVQAPSQIASLFTGSRLVLYAMGPEVTKVELEAEIEGRTECLTVTADQTPTATGLTLHRLATRGIVRDWEIGSVHANRLENDAMMDDVKTHLVKLGVQFNIVSPLTSFIAIEERNEDDESHDDDVPSLDDILGDIWPAWDGSDDQWLTQDASTGIETSCSMTQLNEALSRASGAQKSFSFVTAEHQFKQAMKLATKSFEPSHPAVQKACLALAQFHLRVKGEVQLAHEVLNGFMKHCNTQQTAQLDRKLTNMAKICKNVMNQKAELKDMADQRTSTTPPAAVEDHLYHVDEGVAEDKEIEDEEIVPTIEQIVESAPPMDFESADDELQEAELRAESPEMLEAIRPESPVMLQAQRAESPVMMMHEVQSVKMASVAAMAEPVELRQVERCIDVEVKEVKLRAASPEMLEAIRIESPVMLQAQRAESPVMMMREVQSVKMSSVAAMAEPVELTQVESCVDELRAASPVMLQAQRVESPVMMMREVQSVKMEYASAKAEPVELRSADVEVQRIELRAASPEILDPIRVESPVMLQAQRVESPVMMMREVQSVKMEYASAVAVPAVLRRADVEVQRVEIRAESPEMLEAIRAESPVMLQAQRAESPVMMMCEVQSVKMASVAAIPEPVELRQVGRYIDDDVQEVKLRSASPEMLEAIRVESPVMLRAQRAESPVMMMREVQSVKMEYASAVAEPIELRREIDEDIGQAAPPVMLDAPVMSQERPAQSQVICEYTEVASPAELIKPAVLTVVDAEELVAEVKYTHAVAEPVQRPQLESAKVELQEIELLDESPVVLHAQRAESPVMVMHEVQSVAITDLPATAKMVSPYKSHLHRILTSKKAEDGGIDKDQDEKFLKEAEDEGLKIMRRVLKISNEDEDGWWTWELTDIEDEFEVDCKAIIGALRNPKKSFKLDERLVETWMSSMDVIVKIVAAALVLSMYKTWISLAEHNVPALSCDDAAIHIIPDQIHGWLECCLSRDVNQLCTMAFGETATWSSILEQFPAGIIEHVLRPIRLCMARNE